LRDRLFPWPKGALGWLLASAALLLILWSFAVPIFEAPDEPAHWQYAQYLHTQKQLPVYDARFVEANQPPLYYLLVAPFAAPSALPASVARLDAAGRLISDLPPRFYRNTRDDLTRYWPLRITRLVTCLVSVLTVYFAYLAGVAATGTQWTGLLVGGVTAFLPQFTFRGMSIGNDALVTMTCAATVYLILRLLKSGFTSTLGLLAAVGIATALLSKINALVLPVSFALAVLSEKGRWPERLMRLWVLGVTALLIAPWLLRNVALYGDPLASKAMWTAVPDLIVPKEITAPYFRSDFPQWLWRSFVGRFGWMNLALPEWLYLCFAGLGLLATAGYVWRLARRPAERRLAVVLGSVPVLSLLLLVWLNLTFSQPQGRYMFPALTTIALLLALGLEAWPWWSPRWTIGTVVGLGVVNVGILGGTIVPAYWHFPTDYQFRLDASTPPTRHDLSLRHLFKYYKFRLSVPPRDIRMTAGPLLPGNRYAQSFVAEQSNLTKIEVEFATYTANIETGFVKLHLQRALDDCEQIASGMVPLYRLKDNAFVGLPFPPIPDSKGKTYYIVFEAQNHSQPITVWLSGTEAYPAGSFFVNGQAKPQNTFFRTFYATSGQ
jgi:Predicted membrane protein (DUF2142)